MKSSLKIFAACSVMMLGLNSCDLTGLNDNPNQPTDDVDYNMNEPRLASTLRGGMIIDGNIEQRLKSLQIDFYSQMVVDGSGKWGTRNYVQNDGWNLITWQEYLKQIASLNIVIRSLQAKDGDFTNAISLARVWRVYVHSLASDKFGPMPFPKYSEVEANPPYKAMKDIYTEYFTELDEAIKAFDASAKPIFTDAGIDLVYKNDVKRWQKFANSLRLRLAVRLSEVDKATCIAEAKKSLEAPCGLITAANENAKMPPKADGSWGQNYNYCMFQIDWGGPLNMSKSVEKLLTNIGGIAFPKGVINKSSNKPLAKHPAKVDPRGPKMFMPGYDSGDWAGKRFGCAPEEFNTGEFVSKNFAELGYIVKEDGAKYVDRPYDFFLAEEVHFLKAELFARGYITGDAKAEYEAGVRASFETWGVGDQAAEYLASTEKNEAGTSANFDDQQGAGNTALEKIITQKYIAGIPDLAQEGWNDKRRLNLPRLDVGVYRDPSIYGGADNDFRKPENFIKRMKYPVQESLVNKSEYDKAVQMLGADQVNSKVWWDTNANYCTSAK